MERKTALIAVADGVEEIETLGVADVLKRAGVEVTLAATKNITINGPHEIKFLADTLIAKCVDNSYDLIVVPGGLPGAEYLRDTPELITLLKAQKASGKLFAAICASPVVVFQTHGLLEGLNATCHPALVDQLLIRDNADDRVVVDKNCVTSQGPGTALEFGIKLVELLFNREKAETIAKAMVIRE